MFTGAPAGHSVPSLVVDCVSYHEWIELFNGCDGTVDLGGWMLDGGPEVRATVLQDAASYVIPAGTIIEPSGYRVFCRHETGVALDDDGDVVRLLGPGGVLVDSFTYSAPPGPDGAYGRMVDGSGEWTVEYPPSPGASNAPATPTSTPTATRDTYSCYLPLLLH